MAFKTDIEIAQECEMKPITEIAAKAGIEDKYLEQYGKYKAKIDYNLLKETDKQDGKLILVTAINPTPAGEGKTTTTVGLADGIVDIVETGSTLKANGLEVIEWVCDISARLIANTASLKLRKAEIEELQKKLEAVTK